MGRALVAVLAALGVLSVACSGGSVRDRSAASAVIHPAACPAIPAPAVDDGPDGTPVAAAQPPERTTTVVHHATDVRLDLPEAVRRVRRLVADAELVAQHTVDASGLRVELYSDGPLALDAGQLEAVFAAPFEADAVQDRELRGVLDCYRDRIETEGVLAETRVRMLVPSDPTACLHRIVLGLDPDVARECRSGGVTLPAVDLSLGGVLELEASPLIILAPAAARQDPEQPGRALTRILVHELVHLYDNAMGLFPRPGELMAYEQRAHYVEAQVMDWYARTAQEVPQPIRYPGS